MESFSIAHVFTLFVLVATIAWHTADRKAKPKAASQDADDAPVIAATEQLPALTAQSSIVRTAVVTVASILRNLLVPICLGLLVSLAQTGSVRFSALVVALWAIVLTVCWRILRGQESESGR